jgi:rhamnose utilization protein RhaD (predicted bifunctional aldolase and dehydrogenase)/NAD(P)-dependent dehydrogenase (short-subunit alcohol dehydrogenase family)
MVENRWSDIDRNALVNVAADNPADRALAERVYTSRIMGQDKDVTMHGGGNTSVKVTRKDLLGNDIAVLHVKGSGWDLATIEAPGLPGVAMDRLMTLRDLAALSDEDMVNQLRSCLLDAKSPTPSVETLLHAYLPHKTVDHAHSTATLALCNLPNAAEAVGELYGDAVITLPYIMPGFALAKAAADAYDAAPHAKGMLLLKHGHFTFDDDAKASYDRMIEHINLAEAYLIKRARPQVQVPASPPLARGDLLPTLRGVLADGVDPSGHKPMPVLNTCDSPNIRAFLARDDAEALGLRGCPTPDHVIRTKIPPLWLDGDAARGDRAAIQSALTAWQSAYRERFMRQEPRQKDRKTMLSLIPGVVSVPGLGIVGVGGDASAASVCGDLAEQMGRVATLAEDAGGYQPIGETDLFEMEYWSLEQAKLGKAPPPPFRGRVVLVSGGAGAIGLATAQAFQAQGAEVAVVDCSADALATAQTALRGRALCVTADLTASGAAYHAVNACVTHFGGLDILISNAGAATAGDMASMDDTTLRASFELNFFAHQSLIQAAVAVFRAQGRGGQVLVNISKQAVNPGKNFGAYGLPKATTLFLVKQYALELGREGIRVNGINADRIRSGLLSDGLIAKRAAARSVSTDDYMAGNLLGREVEACHVADGFIALALAERTTGHVLTVDGGNIEASLR